MFSRLYLHIPWCLNKCGYCAFSSRQGAALDLERTCQLLIREMKLSPDSTGPLASIYFGGGTPSLLTPPQVAALLNAAQKRWGLQTDAEITLEANPGTVTREKLSGFRAAGINRISLGVQSFHDATLQLLDRIHTAEEARSALHEARLAGFDNIGIDLICGLPQQTLQTWQADLNEAIRLAPQHLSVYSLSIEDGTPFAERYPEDSPTLPDDDLTATLMETAEQLLCAAGYEHYEIANYARPGFRSRHNSGYWQRDGYLGLGPAAHSMLVNGWGERFSNPTDERRWCERIEAGTTAREERHELSAEEALAEEFFLGLRMADGIAPAELLQRYGSTLWKRHADTLADLLGHGLLQRRDERLSLTSRGMLLANRIFVRFI